MMALNAVSRGISFLRTKHFSRLFVTSSSVTPNKPVTASSLSEVSAEKVLHVTGECQDIPNPLKHEDFFNVSNLFSIKDLIDARVHFGHTPGNLNEHMKEFVIGHRLGTLIFDLDQTSKLLKQALNFTAHIAFRDGIILFVTRYKQHCHLVEKTAMECGEFCHTRFWPIGTFTDPLKFGMMTRLPDLVIFLNILDSVFELHTAVIEANKLLIPSVGIVDTNCFPNLITYPVPGNDDSIQSVELYCKLFKTAILKGKSKREEFINMYGHDFEEKLDVCK